MRRPRWNWIWLLVVAALAACATTPSPIESEDTGCGEPAEPLRREEVCADEGSLIALCEEGQCALYPCQEVRAYLSVGRVVPTRGGGLSLPGAQGAQRYWGSAQKLPKGSRPVFIIPWNHKPPLLPSQRLLLEEAAKERNKPHERHHVFSQEFRPWFERKKINVDEFTLLLERVKHRSIHRGERGGPWNAAWRKWILANDNATKEETFRYAGQLIYEFELFGPVMPYWKQPPPLPPGY